MTLNINFYNIQQNIVVILVLALAFALLSPGVLLTLPPKCDGKVLVALAKDPNSGCATSIPAVLVHTVVFALVCAGVVGTLM